MVNGEFAEQDALSREVWAFEDYVKSFLLSLFRYSYGKITMHEGERAKERVESGLI